MTTHPPSPSLIAPAHDGTLYFALFDAVALNDWTVVLSELAEVARVRGDQDVATVMVVVSSGLGKDSDIDIDELVMQGQPGVKDH